MFQEMQIDMMTPEMKMKLVGQVLLGSIPGLIISAAFWAWEKRTLEEYSEPGTNVITELNPLKTVTGHCYEEYKWLHYCLLFTIVGSVTHISLQVLAVTRPCKGVAVSVVQGVEHLIQLCTFVVSVCGICVTAAPPPSETKDCEHLHYVAWWVFTGLFLIALMMVCCFCGMFGMMAKGRETKVSMGDEDDYEQLPSEVNTA